MSIAILAIVKRGRSPERDFSRDHSFQFGTGWTFATRVLAVCRSCEGAFDSRYAGGDIFSVWPRRIFAIARRTCAIFVDEPDADRPPHTLSGCGNGDPIGLHK